MDKNHNLNQDIKFVIKRFVRTPTKFAFSRKNTIMNTKNSLTTTSTGKLMTLG